jgi:glycosyltransferase involved in cell wall biosynthesis
MRILYVPMFRHPAGGGPAPASDTLGFGVTCSDALVAGLRGTGAAVTVAHSPATRRSRWIGDILSYVEDAAPEHDVVLQFHAFWPFTADLRRVLDDSTPRPLVTYTHGTHWDPTDTFRTERYPALRWADLGNLAAADRVLLVSRHLRGTIERTVRTASTDAAAELLPRLRVVGLPLDLPRIDRARRPRPSRPATVVFNHAPIAAKRPDRFLDVAATLLDRTDAHLLITRRFPPGAALTALLDRHPDRVRLGNDLRTDDYYEALWRTHIQVSTATHESLGVATLEALATGNHALLPGTGAYPEIAAGDPALLYTDLDDLRARLLHAARTPPAQTAHAARIRATYSPARVAGAVAAVLRELS